MLKIMAIDPGGTTGVATAYVSLTEKGTADVHVWQDQANEARLYNEIANVMPDWIVCEDFTFRQKKTGVDLRALHLIGLIKYWDQTHPSSRLVFQQPAVQVEANSMFKKEWLKERGIWPQGATPHGLSAFRHLLNFCEFAAGKQYNIEKYQLAD